MAHRKTAENTRLPQCSGPNVGLLQFQVLKIRKTKAGNNLSVRFKLIVPCRLSNAHPTFVTFLGLTKTTPIIVTAQDVKVEGNVITGKVRIVAKQSYLITSYTFNPSEPLCFTAGAGQQLIAFQ
jgi:hypothetical protein